MISILKNFGTPKIIHASGEGYSGLSHFLSDVLGGFGEFLDEVILHAIKETLLLLPFLFLTYLLMEFIEHKAGDKATAFMNKSGKLGPLAGGALGAIPQCGFSSVGSNLFSGKVISMGTLVAVFLATSDEMIPIMIGTQGIGAKAILIILAYKITVAIAVGFAVDGVLRLLKKDGEKIDIDQICDNDNCHCERGIFYSALHHTATISLFILSVCTVINLAIFLIGSENLAAIMYNKPVISHMIASVFGLIPNCAASVALTSFYTEGFITLGTMLSGLFSGAGIGLIVLFRMNKSLKTNLSIVAIIVGAGIVFGLLADLISLEALL